MSLPLDTSADFPGPEAEASRSAREALRARAEKRSQLVTQAPEHQQPLELQRLVQELQTQQIELEMQYEELLLAQSEAQAARSQYHDLYDFAPVGFFTLDAAGHITQLNLCAAQQLAGVRKGLLGRRFGMFVDLADRGVFYEFLARVLTGPGPQRLEARLHRTDGIPFHAQLEAQRVESSAGESWECRLVVLDVTQRRRAAEAEADAIARFQATFEQSNDGMILLDELHFVDLNRAALRLLGQADKSRAEGRHLALFWPERQPDGQLTLSCLSNCLNLARRTGWCRVELLRRHPQGQEVWDELSFNPVLVQGRPLMHAIWRDVTAARQAREQLRASEEQLRMALSAAASGVWRWEFGPDELHWDARTQEIFGRPFDDQPVPFAVLQQAIHPDDLSYVQQQMQQAIEQRQPFELEHRIVQPDGAVRTVAAQGKVLYDPQGQPLRLAGILRDVTHRRLAQEQLRREKEFSESLLQHSIDGIAAFDPEGRVTAWNAEAARYSRLPAAEVLGRSIFEVYPRFDNPGARAALARVLGGEQVALPGQQFSHREGTFDVYLVPIRLEGGEVSGILAIIRDVTERNRLAEEATQLRLRRQQEVLSAILSTQETERKRIAEALHNGLGQLLYATKLSLEGAGQKAKVPVESLNLLNDAIRTTRTISFELTPSILEDFGLRVALEELVKRISPRQLPVHLHLRGLEQRLAPQVEIAVYRIVQELLNNVLKHANASEVQVHVVREGQLLDVSVEDNGQGFEPEVQARRPLPGIGLAGIRNRLALLGGRLQLQAQPGRGTIVHFELPLEPAGA